MAEGSRRPRASTRMRLTPPLGKHLRSGLDEAAARRIWQNIEARLPFPRRAAPGRWVRATVMAALLVGASGLALWQHGAAQRAWSRLHEPSALQLAQGGNFESVEGNAGTPRAVTLSDGSSIEAGAGARVESLVSTPTDLSLVVRRGRARFSVTPGGPRRWLIEARGARIEVVGTVLSVDASARSVEVQVEVGAVVVRSPLLADGVERLVAGQRLELPALENASLAAPMSEPARAPTPAPLEAPDTAPPVAAATSPSADAGPASSSVSAPPPARVATPRVARPTVASPRASAPESAPAPNPPITEREAARRLWAGADAARAAGDAARAAQQLEQLLREHPDDPRASLAAFTLGTVLEGEPRQPARAAHAFRRALELGLPTALLDTCYARLAEALYVAGDKPGVRALAAEYRAAFPRGKQRSALEALERRAAAPPASGSLR